MRPLAVLLALALTACASGRGLRDYSLPSASVELSDTPFFAQAEFQCGPAALATVLSASGITVTPDELTSQVYLPGREGSLQAEMVAAARRFGRVPYVLRPLMQDLLTEIASGTPVLVLQNLGLSAFPQWHYAVVIGYDTRSDSLVLHSGTTPNLRQSRRRFEASWARAQQWALVTALPQQPPATAAGTTWLQAAQAFEALNQPRQAATAYTAATERWPQDPLAWYALGNARYALRDLSGAEAALRQSLRLAASAATYNNLAQVLLELGCPASAAAELNRADTAADAAVFKDVLKQTRAAIDQHRSPGAKGCPSFKRA